MMNRQEIIRYMKDYVLMVLLFVAALSSFVSCNDEDGEPVRAPLRILPVTQNDLPRGKDYYKILAIGNSYTIDGTAYIEEMLDSAGVDRRNYCLYIVTKGGASLAYWAERLYGSDKVEATRVAGDFQEITESGTTLAEIISHDWDVVVLQQFSQDAIDYATYNPYLTSMLTCIQASCKNKDVAVAWQMVHAYGKNSKENKGLAGVDRWKKNVKATQTMMRKDGIHLIIPTGTAIQLARQSTLNNAYDLTRDNIHLCYGVGRYVAACTWVETLFAPVFGISIEGNTANHFITEAEENDPNESFISGSSVEVNDENRARCQEMALRACSNMFMLE